jgi:hypothetical protein
MVKRKLTFQLITVSFVKLYWSCDEIYSFIIYSFMLPLTLAYKIGQGFWSIYRFCLSLYKHKHTHTQSWSCCSRQWGDTKSLNCSLQQAYCPSLRWYVSTEPQWNDNRDNKRSKKSLSQCHFLYHKSHMNCPRPCGERLATNCLSHGTTSHTL